MKNLFIFNNNYNKSLKCRYTVVHLIEKRIKLRSDKLNFWLKIDQNMDGHFDVVSVGDCVGDCLL